MTPLPDLPASSAPSTAVTTAPGAPPPVFLPQPPAPPPAATTTGAGELALCFLVTALAFLLASFPARNADVWKHLAVGRQLARGDLSSATFPVLQGNPAWLYDLLCYGVYSAVGGAGLVFLKAFVVVGIAVILLRLSRVGRGWVLPVSCTALAVLAMSTRLPLQPVIVSYLFLALTLWFIRDRGDLAHARPAALLPPWPLVALFVLWVNMDGWFVVGLATVALVGVGRSVDEAAPAGSPLPALRRRAVALAVLAAACLLNPSFARAFVTLPPELAVVLAPASAAAPVGGPLSSPFEFRLYLATFGLSPAALAYYPLLLLGLLSFVLNLPRPHWQRLLPWAGLAILSAVQVRAVPFFAVVAGPVLAWNLHSWLTRRGGAAEPAPGGARGLALVLGAAAVVCAWPGWLQVPPFEPRRWSVEPPQSLEPAAAAVKHWHEEGKLTKDSRALHLAPDTLYAFAWFCPEERGVDAPDLAAALRGEQEAAADWVTRMEEAGIDHVIVYDSDRGRFRGTVQRLLPYAMSWPLLYLEGDVAVFGWRNPAAPAGGPDPFAGLQMDLGRMAFHPDKDKRAPREAPAAEPGARQWYEALWKPAPRRSPDQEQAALYLAQAEALVPGAGNRIGMTWYVGQYAATAAAAAGWVAGGPMTPAVVAFDAEVRLARLDPPAPDKVPVPEGRAALDRAVRDWQKRFALQHDDTPPGLLYLAIRAARRAVAANPADAEAYRLLGESYMRLMRSTRERAWSVPGRLADLQQLRSVQASAALNRAAALRPNMAEAHLRLYDLYRGMNYTDLGLEHLRTYIKLTKPLVPRDPKAAQAFKEGLAVYEEDAARLAREVEDRENEYAVATAGGALVLDKARLASQKGLARKARELLLESDVSAFGTEGMRLELRLLLTTGQARKVREWTDPDDQARLGAPQYHWLQVLALAADGDYERAQDEFGAMSAALLAEMRLADVGSLRQAVAALVGQAVLEERPGEGPVANLLRRAQGRVNLYKTLPSLSRQMAQQADVSVLRGLLLLEEGRSSEAEFFFREALKVWRDEPSAASGAGQEFGGRAVAQDCLEWLK